MAEANVLGKFSVSCIVFKMFEDWLKTRGGEEEGFAGGLEREIYAAENFARGEGEREGGGGRTGGGRTGRWRRGGWRRRGGGRRRLGRVRRRVRGGRMGDERRRVGGGRMRGGRRGIKRWF